MDLKKTGAFIAQRRREKGLTQNQLAAHLSVTDKAVSRWECGRGFPDPATLPALAEALGVTVTELVNGEAALTEETREQAEDALLSALQYAAAQRRKTLGAVLLTAGLLCAFYTLLVVGVSVLPLPILGAALTVGGAWLLWSKRTLPRVRSLRAAHLGVLLTLTAAFALEWLPSGVQMRWATPPGEPPHISYCAYFSLLPVGYGNIFPLLTALATTLLLVWHAAAFLRGKRSSRLFTVGVLALLFSLAGALFGTLTPTGWGISLLLFVSLALHALANRTESAVG